MERNYLNKNKTKIYFIISIILIIIVFTCALMIGRYKISIPSFFKAVFTNDTTYETERTVIVKLRIPRTIIAGLTGTAISLSGLLYQETFQNKLTSPSLLGVTSGASVGAALAIVLGLATIYTSLFAFVFGIATVFITIMISKLFHNGSTVTLLLAGIIVGGFMSSSLSFIKYLASYETKLASITYWLMGSFSKATYRSVLLLLPIVSICAILLLMFRWKINIVSLGREEAKTRGMNYDVYRLIIIAVATLLTASAVSLSGAIAWVGLVIPHIVRMLVGRNTSKTIPLAITIGFTFMVIVDILSRTFTVDEIPLSAVTGLFGTLIFIGIIYRKRKERYED